MSALLRSAERILSLYQNPRLAAYVYEWEFNGNTETPAYLRLKYPDFKLIDDLEASYQQVIKAFKAGLPSFLHFRRLALREISLTKKDLQVLSQFPFLHTLKAERRFFHRERLNNYLWNHSLTISHVHGGCPMLTKLAVRFAWGNAIALIDPLFVFFDVCPQLQELTVDIIVETALTFPFVPKTALLLLRSYNGPLSLAILLAPGCRIEHIGKPQKVKYMLTELSQSSVPMKTLAIPSVKANAEIFALIRILYPTLCQLSVDLMDFNEDSNDNEDEDNKDTSEDENIEKKFSDENNSNSDYSGPHSFSRGNQA
ncbi:hypothetical protein M422DRAFT_44927 [Sphaerobolus stellatus SS14]|nr:hypothetical protein M422DRAFT_44927 [Sphaerobolus stellatus SS14]